MHETRSTSRKAAEWSDSTMTMSEHLKIEPAIMASEIERLPDLAGFLKLASVPDWMRVRLVPVSYPNDRAPHHSAPPFAATAPIPATSASASTEPSEAAPTPTKSRVRARRRVQNKE